ncbi:hypothetical protein [Bacteriovorax sp. DB6_IX]|uniref:hypothetical protein n=1 Tax=Bacteriovorax sp. DB6_IX TaxID=1353530 RepID=UPI00040D2D6A|nr:hypothetical protein [Bacteriovorax sp. DB6_IX]
MANIYNELWQMFMLMLASIILFFLLIHSLIYIAHYYDKSFAYSYTKLYAWSGGILMTLFAIINLLTPPAGLFLIPGAILLFIAVGMKRFPFKSKEE